MKKILIVASTFPRWAGDTEPRFILDYAKAIAQYYNVTILVPSAPQAKDHEYIEGIEVIRYRYFPVRSLETLCYPGAIIARIKSNKLRVLLVPFLIIGLYKKLLSLSQQYDIIHAHWLIPQGILTSFVKTPFIVTGHGTDVTSLNTGLIKKLKARCLRKADNIVMVSNSLALKIKETYPKIIKPIHVISMGCDTTAFSPKNRVQNFWKQDGKKIVLFVGRLVEIKGLSFLIDAMNYVDALLIIVGSGPLEIALKEQANPLKDKVRFLGPKTHEELKTIYASADIFVAPSITAANGATEGFGLVLIEAMASGLPVIASHSGGIVDIVKNGENGLLTEEKNIKHLAYNIQLLLTDTTLYKRLSTNAVLTAKAYDYSEIAKKYKSIIDNA